MRYGVMVSVALFIGCVGDSNPVTDAGGNDTGVSDTGSTDTGGPDAPAPDGGTSWCAQNAPTATLCDDFDTDPALIKWTALNTNGGAGAVATTPSKSAPRSFHSSTPAVANNATSSGRLQFTQPGAATQWTVEADVYLDTASGPDAGVPTSAPYAMHLVTATNESAVVLIHPWDGTAAFAAYGTILSQTIPFAAKAWHHVKVQVNRNGTSYDVSCTIDADVKSQTGLTGSVPTSTQLFVGLNTTAPQPALDVYFDNVVFTAK